MSELELASILQWSAVVRLDCLRWMVEARSGLMQRAGFENAWGEYHTVG
jgi:hypothetical protein